MYDGAWRDRTKWSGRPPARGLLTWDPYTRGVMSVSDTGEAFLLPDLAVAQRFMPSSAVPPGAAVQSGRLVTAVTSNRVADLVCSVYRPAWADVGAVNAPLALSSSDALAALTQGVRIWPRNLVANRFSTDYVELTVRYVVSN